MPHVALEVPLDLLPQSLTHTADLEHFQGPLLVEFRSDRGEPYLYRWCDADGELNRWLVFRVLERDLLLFKARHLAYRDLILKLSLAPVFLVDIGNDGVPMKGWLLPPGAIPEDYLPEEGLRMRLQEPNQPGAIVTHTAFLEGKWGIDEIPHLMRDYSSLYALCYATDKGVASKVKDRPWLGGYSAAHFWTELRTRIPPKQRAGLRSVQYASPGFVQFEGESDMFAAVSQCIANFIAHREEIKDLRSYQRKLLKKARADARALDEEGGKEPELTHADAEALVESSREIVELLGVVDWTQLRELLTIESPFKVTQVVRSYVARIEKLVRYQDEKGARIG